MGNICRSPTGEGVFRALVDREGLVETVGVDSAGTISYHAGSRPDARMTRAAAARGYELGGRARQIRREDLRSFDLVVAMDRENRADILTLAAEGEPVAHVRLLSDFLEGEWPIDVPDPYYGGAEGFDRVLDMIEAACPRILAHLLAGDGREGAAR